MKHSVFVPFMDLGNQVKNKMFFLLNKRGALAKQRNRGEEVQIQISLIILIIIILLLRGTKNGSMKFTVKRFLLGLVVTIVIINTIMFFILR